MRGHLHLGPIREQYALQSQGIRGPCHIPIQGNIKEISRMMENSRQQKMELSHDIFSRVFPHFHAWMNTYGKVFYFWNGANLELVVTEPKLVQEILSNDACFRRIKAIKFWRKLIGDGITVCEGEKWEKLRKVANRAFHDVNLKDMIPTMVECIEMMLEKWKEQKTTEVDVCKEFSMLTTKVILRAAFGSSYSEGVKILQMWQKLVIITSRNIHKIRIPFISQLFKSSDDRESEKLEKEIQHLFLQILDQRERLASREAQSYGPDLLGSLLRARRDANERNRITLQEIIDEFKAYFSAGHGSTTSLLSWTVLLLATHSDWQEMAREEVIRAFGQQHPNFVGLPRLRTMNMIINESLRLYPPQAIIKRRATKGAKLGRLVLPNNIKINVPLMALHHDPKVWGDDARLFNPDRFSKGIAAATKNNPAAFSPFGMGPGICVGSNFSKIVAKITLSMFLQHYKFTLSSAYVHSPVQERTLHPQHGVKVILHAL